MVNIAETGTRMHFISIWGKNSTARSARRKARKLLRDFNKYRKLIAKEKESYQKGSIDGLKKNMISIRNVLRNAFKTSMDIIEDTAYLEIKELDDIDEKIRLLEGKTNLQAELTNEMSRLKTYFLEEIREIERLQEGGKPILTPRLGTDEESITKDIKRAGFVEKRFVRRETRANKRLSKELRIHRDNDLSNAIKGFVEKIENEQKQISRMLFDDFMEAYYLMQHINDEEKRLKEYESKGFPKILGDQLTGEFESFKQEYINKLGEVHTKLNSLLNLVSRRTSTQSLRRAA
jgi:hypothetical protein